MSAVDDGARVVRHATAFTEPQHVAVVRVSGAGAEVAIQRLTTGDLRLHDSQARPSLILREDGSVLADVVVGRILGEILLFVDGASFEEVAGLVHEASAPGAQVRVQDVREERELVSLHGPFAWELLAAWLGRYVVALPPLTLSTTRSSWLLRSGRTGEYGYELLIPRATLEEERGRLLELGAAFDLRRVPQGSVDRCTLEAGGFVVRRAPLAALSPIELQLQWRVADKPDHRGKAGLDARRARSDRRIAWFRSPDELSVAAALTLDGAPVGRVLTCEPLSIGAGFGGIAAVDRALAHPGLSFDAGGVTLTTVSAPLVEPTSLRVRVHSDSYPTRDRSRFPGPATAA